MKPDTTVWAIILFMTVYVSLVDIRVIHGKYQLGPKHMLNILLHQFVILTAMLGAFFVTRPNIHAHLFLVVMSILCMLYFKGCFMAQWQRDNVVYTPEDFLLIQKPKERRMFEFLSIIVPVLLIDLYKLRVLP
jgi:hypothetical protein